MEDKPKFWPELPPVPVAPLYRFLYRSSVGYKSFCALKAALELKLFDHLISPRRAEEVARAAGLDPVITANLCRYLAELGLLEQEGELYHAGALGELYLRSDAPRLQKRVLQTLERTFRLWEGLAERAREGPLPVTEEAFFGEDHIHALAAEALCGELQRTVRVVAEFPDFWQAKKLLDLGGGHGLCAVAFAKLRPELEVCVFDLPAVLIHTARYASDHGVKLEFIGGDFWQDELGKGYDIVFFAYNPGGKKPELLPKIHASLNPGGLFVSKHCFYARAEASKSALLDLEWSLTALARVKKAGRVYSFTSDLSYEDYLERLGELFAVEKIMEAEAFAGPPLGKIGDALDSRIIVARKK
ncbi:methyltransferase [Desulfothermobacter acidiphilus]|uniref:methyltransferase n=1 Tax=Desulfothermobacter acidiphilus TaxID=1938353 RepID=UPI003F893FC5